MNLTLSCLINKPICVFCEHEWQKGYALAQFKNCDNKFRLEDEDFKFVHFRTLENFTFYTDEKGISPVDRDIYTFYELFKL